MSQRDEWMKNIYINILIENVSTNFSHIKN